MAKVGETTRPKAATAGAAGVSTEARKASKVTADVLKRKGQEEFNKLSDEQKAAIGSKSASLKGVSTLFSHTTPQSNGDKTGYKVLGIQVENVGEEDVNLILGTVVGKMSNSKLIEVEFTGDKKTQHALKKGESIGLAYAEVFVNFFNEDYACKLTGGEITYEFRVSTSKKETGIGKVPGVATRLAYTDNRKDADGKKVAAPSVYDVLQPISAGEAGAYKPAKGYERFAPYFQRAKKTNTGSKGATGSKVSYEYLALKGTISDLLK